MKKIIDNLKCKECDRIFTTKGGLYKHLKCTHGYSVEHISELKGQYKNICTKTEHKASCKARDKKMIKDENGLTAYDKITKSLKDRNYYTKRHEKWKSEIDQATGKSKLDKIIEKSNKSKRIIDQVTGKTSEEIGQEKRAITMEKNNSANIISKKVKNSLELEKNTIDVDGVSLFDKRNIKALNTRENKYRHNNYKDVVDKYKITMGEKYGGHYSQTDEFKNINRLKNLKIGYKSLAYNKNIKPLFTLKEYLGSNNHSEIYKWECKQCNKVFEGSYDTGSHIPRCPVCYPKYYPKSENEIKNYILKYKVNCISNSRSIIKPLELDIYIPNKKIAIEFNGNYWHSELNGKDRNYHLNKTKLCNKKDIRLIHIFEDEWLYKQQIVKSRLKNILGLNKYKIGARKCTIKVINNKLKNKFLDKYHIQGQDKSSVKLGAFYKNKLVAVMTFGKRRFDKHEGFELIRFCTIANFNIVGIASKLLKHFERNYNEDNLEIISYADRRWSDGGLYKALGFDLSHISAPNFFVMKDHNHRESRLKYQKHKLESILENYDPSISANQNMTNNGYDRIWDCGNYVFKK